MYLEIPHSPDSKHVHYTWQKLVARPEDFGLSGGVHPDCADDPVSKKSEEPSNSSFRTRGCIDRYQLECRANGYPEQGGGKRIMDVR
jgi:hypothetical protein